MVNGAGLNISIDGIDACMRSFGQLEGELRKNANGELRAASNKIGRLILGQLGPAALEASAPQALKVAGAARIKSDRYVVVRVPQVNTKLSGTVGRSRGRAYVKYQIGWATETGSSYPQFRTPTGSPGWIRPNRDRWAKLAIPLYTKAIGDLMTKYGLRP